MNDGFTLLFLDGWARGFHKVAPEKPECESFHHFENIFQTILGPSVFHISSVLVQFVGQISSHCKVLRNDHLCSGSWLLMLVSVVAAPRPSLKRTWHETVQCTGRNFVSCRRQPCGLCSWTWGSKRPSLQTSER